MSDNDTLQRMIDVDRLVHEPARLVILTVLYVVEWADFIFLLHQTGLGKGNLSSHLSRLEQAEYITIEKTYRGKTPMTTCQMTEKGRAAFEAYHEQLKDYVDSVNK
ncbi:MAG: transcriptional regulator [Anaerolineales bacterium]|jgi:DNA-binding transcriptional ArsR family regulator